MTKEEVLNKLCFLESELRKIRREKEAKESELRQVITDNILDLLDGGYINVRLTSRIYIARK